MKEIEYAINLDLRPWRRATVDSEQSVAYIALFAVAEVLRFYFNKPIAHSGDGLNATIFAKYFVLLTLVAISLAGGGPKRADAPRPKRTVANSEKLRRKFVLDSIYVALVSASLVNVFFFFSTTRDWALNLIADFGGTDKIPALLLGGFVALAGALFAIFLTTVHMITEARELKSKSNIHYFIYFQRNEVRALLFTAPLIYLFASLLLAILLGT